MPSSRKNHMPGTGLSSYMSRLRLVPSKQTVFFRIGKLSKTSETKILYICRTISSVPSWTENSSQPVLCAHQSQALFTGISCMMQKRSCHYQSPQTGMLGNHLTDSRCSELHCSRRVNGLRLQVHFLRNLQRVNQEQAEPCHCWSDFQGNRNATSNDFACSHLLRRRLSKQNSTMIKGSFKCKELEFVHMTYSMAWRPLAWRYWSFEPSTGTIMLQPATSHLITACGAIGADESSCRIKVVFVVIFELVANFFTKF